MSSDAIAKFEAALAEWGGSYESKTYPALHGWTVPDDELGVYDAGQAERHYTKLKEFFAEVLRQICESADSFISSNRSRRRDRVPN